MPTHRLVLASASPARLTVLRAAGFAPEVVVSAVPEDGVDHLPIAKAAVALAERKAAAVAERLADPALVVGCDSMLSIDGTMRGKPSSIDEARSWLRGWRGRSGVLVTGQTVVDTANGRQASGAVETEVRYGDPSDEELEAYLATGEALQVAGAFTIDGYAAPFVAGIDGDPGGVMGLSLPLLRSLLAQIDVPITSLWTT